jgi:4-hydroxybenzoate polyprenyltransferase
VLQKARNFLRFVKIEHTFFSLPMIFSGVYLSAKELPGLSTLVLILLGATGARSVALALNRIIDREIDKRNPRTLQRELPSGKMTSLEAGAVLLIGAIIYFVSAALISRFCLFLSPLPVIVFTLYPYMKRFTPFCHFGVGLGLAMAPLGGWFAVHPTFDGVLPALLLSFFTLFWVAGFDVIYSTLDELFDRVENLYSFTSRYGKQRALRYSGYLHFLAFLFLGALFAVYIRALLALPFLVLSGVLLYLENKKAEDVELAFFKINAILGFSVLGMVVMGVIFA